MLFAEGFFDEVTGLLAAVFRNRSAGALFDVS
jgi:hypothetical protein